MERVEKRLPDYDTGRTADAMLKVYRRGVYDELAAMEKEADGVVTLAAFSVVRTTVLKAVVATHVAISNVRLDARCVGTTNGIADVTMRMMATVWRASERPARRTGATVYRHLDMAAKES